MKEMSKKSGDSVINVRMGSVLLLPSSLECRFIGISHLVNLLTLAFAHAHSLGQKFKMEKTLDYM